MLGQAAEGDPVAAGVGEAARREDVQLEGEQPHREQRDPEDRGGLQDVGGGGDRAVREGAGAAGREHAEDRAEQDGGGERDGAQQRGPQQPFADDLGHRLPHHRGLAEVAAEGGGQPVPPAGGERPVHAEVLPQPVQGLLVGAERGRARVRPHRVERGRGGDGEHAERDDEEHRHGVQRAARGEPCHGAPGGVGHGAGCQSSTFHQGPAAKPCSCGSVWVVRPFQRSASTYRWSMWVRKV